MTILGRRTCVECSCFTIPSLWLTDNAPQAHQVASKDFWLLPTITLRKLPLDLWLFHASPLYPTGTSKCLLMKYKASHLWGVLGWSFTCAAEVRDFFHPVALGSNVAYKGALDALSELGML